MKILIIFALSILTISTSNAASTLSSDDIKKRLYPLFVTPFDFKSPLMNKRIYFHDYHVSCENKKRGLINFIDFEGGSVRKNFGDTKMEIVGPQKSIRISANKYKDNIETPLRELKNKYCMDVNLAPVIDISGSRSFHEDIGDIQTIPTTTSLNRLEDFTNANHNAKLIPTFKHYPVSVITEPDSQYYSALNTFGKPAKELYKGYIEAGPASISECISDPACTTAKKHTSSLLKNMKQKSMVMITNRLIKEIGWIPYVISDLPSKDSDLQGFKGLIITDDLFQINATDHAVQIFTNADLFIMTSYKDLKIFLATLEKAIQKNSLLQQALIKKSNKVEEFFNFNRH